MHLIGLFACAIASALLVLICLNRFARPARMMQSTGAFDQGEMVGDTLRVVTWNIGFGGLDRSVSLQFERVLVWRPKTPNLVKQNVQAIARQLSRTNSDITLLQETAKPGFLTRNIDVVGQILDRLSPKWSVYWPDMRLRVPLAALSINHGMSVFSHHKASDVRLAELPQSDTRFLLGLLRKFYGGVITRLPAKTGPDWVLINVHLSAFADAKDNRQAQIARLFEYGAEQARAGHHVVIGGDWNLNLPRGGFDGSTRDDHEFPDGLLPKGWMVFADGKTPSARDAACALDDPKTFAYIDGFAVSPSVECRSVTTHDLGFEHADHNPVEAVFAARQTADDLGTPNHNV